MVKDTQNIAFGVCTSQQTDEIAICKITGRVVEYIKYLPMSDTAPNQIFQLVNSTALIGVDATERGLNLMSSLQALGLNVVAVDGTQVVDTEIKAGIHQFANIESSLWWSVRESLDPEGDAPIALPSDEKLTQSLISIAGSNENGKTLIKAKNGSIRHIAYALALALYASSKIQ